MFRVLVLYSSELLILFCLCCWDSAVCKFIVHIRLGFRFVFVYIHRKISEEKFSISIVDVVVKFGGEKC